MNHMRGCGHFAPAWMISPNTNEGTVTQKKYTAEEIAEVKAVLGIDLLVEARLIEAYAEVMARSERHHAGWEPATEEGVELRVEDGEGEWDESNSE